MNIFIDMKRILIFGAGKIGRAFIGQIFSMASYEIIFVDVEKEIIDLLNARREYQVEIRDRYSEIITVQNVRGILASDTKQIIEEIASTDLIVTSVGLKALPSIAPVIAEGINLKYRKNPELATDIILAENIRDASNYFSDLLTQHLPLKFPLSKQVGLIETSIGKMVPLMTEEEMAQDPTIVYAEAYSTLILDGKGFRNPIPEIRGIAPKDNIKAWADRKLFIHNMGHALAAYFGNACHPDMKYMYEILADNEIETLTRKAMKESGEVLRAIYPHEFSKQELREHIEDLIRRFKNKLLGDTVYRVGTDLRRKLGKSDRIAIPLQYAIQYQLPFRYILSGYKAAMQFTAKNNNLDNPNDTYVTNMYREKGLAYVMREVSGLDPELCQEEGTDIPFEI
jgi:mannitol-1-phosphate 5-dehydrogenase